ncbi:MAG: PfkB family carbohydrate kinase [Albidovulum sp.]|nr:PfkB family carbohydrate kinase [Albidovulum sp.]MDE0304976.1 PfkB family carbohydrate kinase [Albidovulum sp.]MDE0530090.1 PfkB family carbohydrate kinase [Albidovulum sp.]
MSRALFVGRSVIDLTSLVEDFPASDSKVKALANDVIPGGSALNAAVTFAHLGGEAHLASSLGNDGPFHSLLYDDLRRYDVTPINICADSKYRIPISTVISTRSSGDRMIINDSGEECIHLRDLPGLLDAGYDLIQLDQYERAFVRRHRDAIRDFKGPVILDGGSWKEWSREYLRLADIPIVSEHFYAGGPDAFAAECAALGIERWAMTRGSRGVIWQDGARRGEIQALEVHVVDTLGAGDIFHGAFCHAFCETSDFVAALERANRCAAHSCNALGTRGHMNS